jgi:exodeoxyribonuclease VIII
MTETNPVFLVRRAKKQAGEPDAVLWCSDDFEAASATLDYLLLKSGRKLKDYFKPVATNFPVVNELPPEGEISFTFCDYYQLGTDGMTWEQIPGVTLPASTGTVGDTPVAPEIASCVDTSTGEILEEDRQEYADDENAGFQLTTMPFRIQLLAQYTAEEGHVYHISIPCRKRLAAIEMDDENHAAQNLLLAVESIPEIKKYDLPTLWKVTSAVKQVFPEGKRHELATMLQFLKTWIATPHIDRGILVKEWAAGKRITSVQRTPSGANAGGGNVTDRKTPLTRTGLAYEIAAGLYARKAEFDIYNPPFKTECAINAIMNDCDNQEFTATVKIFEEMPGGLDYSRACNIATVKTTPEGYWKDPVKHREYLNRVMIETDHAHPDEAIVAIACGHSSAPMPMAPQPEKAASAPELLREEVSRQLAAERGEFVSGISDPTDPNWVHEDLSQTASNEGEKTEVASDPDNGPVMGDATYAAMEESLREDLEIIEDVPVQEVNGNEEPSGDALSQDEDDVQQVESADGDGVAATVESGESDQKSPETDQIDDSAQQIEPEENESEPELQSGEPVERAAAIGRSDIHYDTNAGELRISITLVITNERVSN